MAKSGQRFIRENRAPRVHIEYEVETYGSLQKVELPFVMGVMSDLSGQSHVEKKVLDKRDFVEFDMDNFDRRMEAVAPRAAFNVDNTLTGDGQLSVDLNFKTIEDFSPGKVAKRSRLSRTCSKRGNNSTTCCCTWTARMAPRNCWTDC